MPLTPLTKANLKLVKATAADQEKLRRVAEKVVLPDFAKRCGKACSADWTSTVGKILGVKATAQ